MNIKKLFMAFAIVAMSLISSIAYAGTFVNVQSTTSTKGNISGTLTVKMGDHTNSFTNFSDLTVTENADNTIDIKINNLQIGSMPGKISIDAEGVSLNDTEEEYTDVVTFKFISTSYYDANIKASKVNGKIIFSIVTLNAKYLGVPFTANVEFVQD